jgi:hypothetical protein
MMSRLFCTILATTCFVCASGHAADVSPPVTDPGQLPKPGTLRLDKDRGEVILCATVQHPKDRPCIDDWGERIQAFVGCAKAAGGDAKMADYFVFLVDVPTEEVHDALIKLGAKTRVHYSMEEGHKRSGLKPETKADDYLQGDPVILSILWKDNDRWIEKPYQDFVEERVVIDGKAVVKPWTPSFVFHGSGVIHKSRTGCIACPCDCAGGIIADNRFPLYDPKPTVRFNWDAAPKVGTPAYVRIRPVCSK